MEDSLTMFQSAWAAITKYHKLAKTTEFKLAKQSKTTDILEARGARSRCEVTWFLMRAHSPACSHLSFCCVPYIAFFGT